MFIVYQLIRFFSSVMSEMYDPLHFAPDGAKEGGEIGGYKHPAPTELTTLTF